MPRWASSTTPLKVKKPLSALTWGAAPRTDDQMVLTHRDGDGVPQRETPPVAQKAAVRIRQRGACASGFAQLLQPAGDLLQPLLERRDVLGRQLLAGSFVR